MMNRRRVVYPLFFVLLAIFILPSIQKAHALTPSLFSNTSGTGSGTVTPVTNIAANSEIIVIGQIGGGATCPAPSITDTFGSTYSQQLCTLVSTGATVGSIWIMATTQITSSSGSNTLSVACGNICSFAILDYTQFTGFGVSDTFTSGSASGASTRTISVSAQSIIIGIGQVHVDGVGCGTVTTGSSQTVLATLTCQTQSGAGSSNSLITSNTGPSSGGSYSDTLNWSGGGAFGRELLELKGVANGGSSGFFTQCYGNCGTPAITLANTNSTHTVNFNGSLTLFYEFQSQVNGNVNNVTTNMAKTYTNGMSVSLGLYTASCNTGVTPFTAACPGQQQVLQTFQNPVKGTLSMILSSVTVQNQQWVAIAVSCVINGCDLNDTNTSVALFNQAPSMPPILSSATALPSSKMGLWAFITGVSGGPPPIVQQPSCGADFICILTNAILSLTPTNPFAGAIFLAFMWSIFSTLGIIFISGYLAKSFGQSVTLPPGVFLMIWFAWFMFFPALVGAIWFTVLVMIILILTFASFSGALLKGGVGVGGQTA